MGATLAIDTSAGTCVAILRNGKVVAEVNNANHMAHAESIGSAISDALQQAGITRENIISVVVGRGPAPFTGLRVGIAAAMMFAEGAKAKLSGVISLDAIALAALRDGAATPLLVETDARRKEVYYAIYSGLDEHGIPICIEGPAVIKPEVLAQQHPGIQRATGSITAAALAELTDAMDRAGRLSSDVSALYLRQPDAVEGQFGKKVSG